jgi:Transposase DDE domain
MLLPGGCPCYVPRMRTTSIDTVRCRFFAPVEAALREATHRRQCPEFSDEEFLESGIGRVIEVVQSGRDWVQQLQMWMKSSLTVSTFFGSLKSQRRLLLSGEVDEHVRGQLDEECGGGRDPLAAHRELDGFAVYASDGHFEAPSTHGPVAGEKAQPVGFFYTINLRSHSLGLLDIARPKRKREHDMSVLKRIGATGLRMGAATGTKVIHAYDPAGIDYAQWIKWKARGIYFISREKSNSAAEVVGERSWDRDDPRNVGILADEFVGVFAGVMLRRVRYRDPDTETQYTFMTSEMTLPPGLISFLYKLRWDVEKVFDEKKNKLQEKKAWAGSPVARQQQALFVCLAHNLLVILENCLEREDGIRDEKVLAKRAKRMAQTEAGIRKRGGTPNPMVQQHLRPTQRSLQFIRWVRACLRDATCWDPAIALLRPLMANYIT